MFFGLILKISANLLALVSGGGGVGVGATWYFH